MKTIYTLLDYGVTYAKPWWLREIILSVYKCIRWWHCNCEELHYNFTAWRDWINAKTLPYGNVYDANMEKFWMASFYANSILGGDTCNIEYIKKLSKDPNSVSNRVIAYQLSNNFYF